MNTFYRNISDITSREGIFIEAGSLFELVGETLVLVDDDVFATAPYDESLFQVAFTEE